MADKDRRWSPYRYAYDNPLRFIDPDGMFEDWVKDNKTGEYEWDDNVTSASNTPAGKTYVGKEDNDIVKDLGYPTTARTVVSEKKGAFHADAEEGDPSLYKGSYGVAEGAAIQAKTTTQITADVTTTIDANFHTSKTFNGLRENINMTVRSSSNETVSASAEVTFKSTTGVSREFNLAPVPSHPNGDFKAEGTSYLSGAVTMTADEAKSGMRFPSLNISGNFFRGTTDSMVPLMPTVMSGQLNPIKPVSYSQFIPGIYPKKP